MTRDSEGHRGGMEDFFKHLDALGISTADSRAAADYAKTRTEVEFETTDSALRGQMTITMIEAIRDLPADATADAAIERLVFLAKIAVGQAATWTWIEHGPVRSKRCS